MNFMYQLILTNYFHLLAKFYILINSPLKAVSVLEKAIEISPHIKTLYFSLARAYQVLEKWDDLIISMERASQAYPDDLSINYRIGILALDIRHGELAIKHLLHSYNQISKSENWLTNIQALLGAAYILSKDWDKAEKHLSESILLCAWELNACGAMIQLYLCNKRSRDILGFIDTYINEYPTLYPFYAWKGNYFQYNLRQPEKSLEFYQLALKKMLYKKARDFCDNYAFTKGMFDEILDNYIEALITSKQSSIVLEEIKKYESYKLGSKAQSIKRKIFFYASTRKFDEAENFLKRLDSTIKESPELLASIAFIKNKEGRFSEAKEIVEKAIRIDKDYIESYGLLGEIQINMQNWKEALDTYSYISNRDFYTAFEMKKIGFCYFHLGNLDKAIEFYKETLLHDEFDAETWINLGDAYQKQGSRELALSAYKNSVKFDWLSNEKREYALKSIEQVN